MTVEEIRDALVYARDNFWQESVVPALDALDRLEAVLEQISAPKRPDGTYNLSREACEEIARHALSKGDGVGRGAVPLSPSESALDTQDTSTEVAS